jgi:hypothetical protein
MFHLAAYNASIAQNSLLALSLVFDEHWTPNSAGAALLPYDCDIKAVFGIGVTLNRLQLNAPSLRRVIYPEVDPIEIGATVPAYPKLQLYDPMHQPHVIMNEGLQPFAQQGSVGAETEHCLIWAEPQEEQAPNGLLYTFRFTGTIAGVSGAWAGGAMTPVDTIPQGKYAVVGMSIVGANLLAGRLLFYGGGPRPGVMASNANGNGEWNWMRHGRAGLFGYFTNTTVPLLQVYAVGANAAQTVWLDLIKVA